MKRFIRSLNPPAFKSSLFVIFTVFTLSVYAQAPTGENIQSFCSQATWQNAGFTAMPGDNLGDLQVHGENLIWYDGDPAGTPPGNVIPDPNLEILVDGDIYYVTQTVGGVESAPLTVTVMENSCACIKEPDFETQDGTGDAEGYVFYEQDISLHKTCGMFLTPGVPTVPLGTTNSTIGDAVFVTDAALDPIMGSYGITLSRTNPSNPNSSVGMMLSGEGLYADNAAEIITMTKEFVAGEVFVFNYAMALENPGASHGYDGQPFFQIRLYDQNNNLVQGRCIVSTETDCVFLDVPAASTTTLYTEWSCYKINTMDIQGEAARIEFTIADCDIQGHWGYVFIDDLYVGEDAGSGCNDYNFGYLAINNINPSSTNGNGCYVVRAPAAPGACSVQATASLPFPMEICGVYEAPSSSGGLNLEDLTIDITQNGVVVGTVSNPVYNGNTFCFTIDETDINVDPYGDFEISSSINFELDCGAAYNIVIDDQTDFEACPPAGCPLPLTFCDDGTGAGTFDLTQREGVLTNGWQNGVTFTYYEDENDAFDETNKIADPANFTTQGSKTIYVRADWDLPGAGNDNCFYLVELEVEVLGVPEFDLGDDDIVFCGSANMNIPLGATPTNLADLETITYEWKKDGVTLPVLGSIYTATAPGTYTVTVANNLECPVTDQVVIERVDYSVDLGNDLDLCGDTAETTLNADIIDNGSTNAIDMSQVTYSWSTGETTPSITITESGTYSVETTYKGCVETDQISVVLAIRPKVSLGADFDKCIDEEVSVTANVSNAGSSTFEFTWYRDGGVISGETGSAITTTQPGTYRVEVRESGAGPCFGEDTIEVTLYANENCVITQGISPNGDGFNQSLDLAFLNDRTGISNVEIFNRHGRLVYEKSGGYTNEWFGQTTEGDELVTGTYFYVIKLDGVDEVFDKQVLTGWIYINRQVN